MKSEAKTDRKNQKIIKKRFPIYAGSKCEQLERDIVREANSFDRERPRVT
jgi:hypothetical protein